MHTPSHACPFASTVHTRINSCRAHAAAHQLLLVRSRLRSQRDPRGQVGAARSQPPSRASSVHQSRRHRRRFEGAAPYRPSRHRRGGRVPGRRSRRAGCYFPKCHQDLILEDLSEGAQAISLAILLANWSSTERSSPLDFTIGRPIFDAGYHKRAHTKSKKARYEPAAVRRFCVRAYVCCFVS